MLCSGFAGPHPDTSKWTNLEYFGCFDNSFNGPAPVVRNATKLVQYQIFNNAFTGGQPELHPK